MCGICGFIDYTSELSGDVLEKMTNTLNHRGPDGLGIYEDKQINYSVGLGHTRLAILDLSSAGKQPMHFKNLSIVLNGEIYNFKEIRKDLEKLGHKFFSNSDTEVALLSFFEWGVNCVSYFIGMYSFTIYDKDAKKVYFFRDRAGVKPLYLYFTNDLVMFSSELKAFFEHPKFKKEISLEGLTRFFNYGYIPAPYSIFVNCEKVLPGHYIEFDLIGKKLNKICYWDLEDSYQKSNLKISYNDAKSELNKILSSAFDYRMVSDVPVGVFLSGGYDSTAVASIIQKGSSKKIKTFTIGFNEGVNEAPQAKKIAAHLGTDHTEYYCTYKEAKAIIEDLAYYYDEPFSDSSAIPTILVSKLAKNDVTVALSADGGDEIFCGYNKYDTFLKNMNLFKKVNFFPRAISSSLLNTIRKVNTNIELNEKLNVINSMLGHSDQKAAINLLTGYDLQGESYVNKLMKNGVSIDNFNLIKNGDTIKNELSIALLFDYKQYLPDDILTKVDRATMSVSLEGREPFLDHRIVEFVAKLPTDFKYKNGIKKYILKDIVHDLVPPRLMGNVKLGFGLPLNSWLKNDLKYLIEDLLSETNFVDNEYINEKFLVELKTNFLNHSFNPHNLIWKIIIFQLWFNKWMKK